MTIRSRAPLAHGRATDLVAGGHALRSLGTDELFELRALDFRWSGRQLVGLGG